MGLRVQKNCKSPMVLNQPALDTTHKGQFFPHYWTQALKGRIQCKLHMVS